MRDEKRPEREDTEPVKKKKEGTPIEFYHYGEEPPGTPPVMPESIGETIFKEPGVPSSEEQT